MIPNLKPQSDILNQLETVKKNHVASAKELSRLNALIEEQSFSSDPWIMKYVVDLIAAAKENNREKFRAVSLAAHLYSKKAILSNLIPMHVEAKNHIEKPGLLIPVEFDFRLAGADAGNIFPINAGRQNGAGFDPAHVVAGIDNLPMDGKNRFFSDFGRQGPGRAEILVVVIRQDVENRLGADFGRNADRRKHLVSAYACRHIGRAQTGRRFHKKIFGAGNVNSRLQYYGKSDLAPFVGNQIAKIRNGTGIPQNRVGETVKEPPARIKS